MLVNIFSLAEGDAFLNVLRNHLGWALEPTSDAPKLKPTIIQDEKKILLEKIAERGDTLIIRNIFTPFREPEVQIYQRNYHDEAMRNLRRIKETPGLGVRFELDNPGQELSRLIQISPPISDWITTRLFPGQNQ